MQDEAKAGAQNRAGNGNGDANGDPVSGGQPPRKMETNALIAQIRDLVEPPERRKPLPWMPVKIGLVTLLGLLPVLLLLIAGRLVTPPDIALPPATADLDRTLARAEAGRDAVIARTPHLAPTRPGLLLFTPLPRVLPFTPLRWFDPRAAEFSDLAEADRIVAAIEARIAAAKAGFEPSAKNGLALYRSKALLVAGVIVILPTLLALLYMQARLVQRCWLRATRNRFPHANGPPDPRWFYGALAVFALAGGLIVAIPPFAPPDGSATDLARYAGVAGLGLVPALLCALAATWPRAASGRKRIAFEQFPAVATGTALLCGGVVATWLLARLDLPGGLHADGFGLDQPWIATAGRVLIVVMVAMIAVTAFGTYMLGRHVPRLHHVEALFRTRNWNPATQDANTETEWAAMRSDVDRYTGRYPAVPGDQPPAVAATLIDALSRALSVAMILALTLVALTLEYVQKRLAADPEINPLAARLAKDVAENLSHAVQGWLVLVGASFSLALALVYVLPRMRVHLHVEAYAAAKAAAESGPEIWSGVSLRDGRHPERSFSRKGLAAKPTTKQPGEFDEYVRDALDLTPKKAPTAAEAKDMAAAEDRLARIVGVDRTKFSALLKLVKYGGGFHGVLEEGLQKRMTAALTLIAPAALGTAIALLN